MCFFEEIFIFYLSAFVLACKCSSEYEKKELFCKYYIFIEIRDLILISSFSYEIKKREKNEEVFMYKLKHHSILIHSVLHHT